MHASYIEDSEARAMAVQHSQRTPPQPYTMATPVYTQPQAVFLPCAKLAPVLLDSFPIINFPGAGVCRAMLLTCVLTYSCMCTVDDAGAWHAQSIGHSAFQAYSPRLLDRQRDASGAGELLNGRSLTHTHTYIRRHNSHIYAHACMHVCIHACTYNILGRAYICPHV